MIEGVEIPRNVFLDKIDEKDNIWVSIDKYII